MKYPQLVSMPSAVSDWLEEQLEARGIDSEVYTRYILSLLHAHTLDVIYPEEDFSLSQLKKNCEIESLVDELCEKLKEVNSEAENSSNLAKVDTKTNKEPLKHRQRKISPRELAEKYYAAFPPLNQKEEHSYLTSNINLVVGKWPSPEKSLNKIDLIAAKWTSSGSPKKTKRKPKRQPYDNMKPTSRTSQNRNRFGYKKAHCVRALTREMADNRANWECVYNNNNNYKMNDQCLDSFVPTMAEANPDYFNMDEENDFPVQWMKDWMAKAETGNQNNAENNLQNSANNGTQFIPVYPSSIWSNRKQNKDWSKTEYARRNPLDSGTEGKGSPIEQESAIREEYQRCIEEEEEEEECAIKMEYERSYGEDIKVHVGAGRWAVNKNERSAQTASRWSTKIVQPIEHVSRNSIDFNLSQSNDNSSHDLLDSNIQNETNNLLEDMNRRRFTPSVFRNFRSLPAAIWGDYDVTSMYFSENECLFDAQTMSLMKINHNKERSAFGEYVRSTSQKGESLLPLYGPYSRPFGRPVRGPDMPIKVVPTPQVPKEGMWASPLVLFRPIQTPPPKSECSEEPCRKYHDGATFAISGGLDKVDFKRTNSGTLFIETEFGESKRYLEYQWQPSSDESLILPRTMNDEFKLKFLVSQNDKANQTENEIGLLALIENFSEITETAYKVMESMDFGKESETSEESTSENEKEVSEKCDQCGGLKSESCEDMLKIKSHEENLRTNSTILAEMVWKGTGENCKLCEGEHQWLNLMHKIDFNWEAETLKDIWEGTEVRRPHPRTTIEPLFVETTTELREENAEGLVSDISSSQQAFTDSARFRDAQFKTKEAPTDRKRRHSYMDNDTEMWSFATRLQEDCLINLSTLPTRRSVTL